MSKRIISAIKHIVVIASSYGLVLVAELFSGATCTGRLFEPKMPEKLAKRHD